MARHRAVRSMNIDDELDEDDDHYGHSFEDNYCISPATAAQFTFNRDEHTMASYMVEPDIPEEDNEEDDDDEKLQELSTGKIRKQLNDIDTARLNSCLEEIHNVLGETTSEQTITEAIIKNNFDVQASLNELLTQQGQDVPKPQRAPRSRRNRSQGDSDDDEMDCCPDLSAIGDMNNIDKNMYSTHDNGVCKLLPTNTSRCDSSQIADLQLNTLQHDAGPACVKTLHQQKNQTTHLKHNTITQQALSLSDLVKLNHESHSSCNQEDRYNRPKVSCVSLVSLSKLASENNSKAEAVSFPEFPLTKTSQTSGKKVGESVSISLSELAKKHQSQSIGGASTQECYTESTEKGNHPLSSLDHKHTNIFGKLPISSSNLAAKDHRFPTCNTVSHLQCDFIENANAWVESTSAQVRESMIVSLADLAKQNSTIAAKALPLIEVDGESNEQKPCFDKPVGINLSLADLAKMHKPAPRISNPQNSHDTKAELNLVSLSSLARSQKLGQVSSMDFVSNAKPNTHSSQPISLLAKDNSRLVESNDESKLLYSGDVLSDGRSENIFLMESIASVIKMQLNLSSQNPSLLGKALCLRCFKANKRNNCRKFPKCSYNYQNKNKNMFSVVTFQHILPFDFSTPSPDDIVQQKQKEAFSSNACENK